MIKSEKLWDFLANKYDKTEQNLEHIFIKIHENTKKFILPNDIVLDYACGTGTLSVDIANHVKEIHAVDISSKMLEIARSKADERKIKNINFVKAVISDGQFKQESYDVILAFGLLHLLEDCQQVIKRIYDLLKPGGLFISSTPCLGEKMTFVTKLKFYPPLLISKTGLIPQHLTRFKISELDELIGKENFQIIETEKIFYKLTAYFMVAKKN
jgi:2-polyprenyl-3-methyl-5-hydroxy-6-metoxy-1,4-benzoquinol methylase